MRPDQWLHVQPKPTTARRDWGPMAWLFGPFVALWLTDILLHGGTIL
jgi:hypothetical protein